MADDARAKPESPRAKRARRGKSRLSKRKRSNREGPRAHAATAVDALHRLLSALARQKGLSGELPLDQLTMPLTLTTSGSSRKKEIELLIASFGAHIDDALKAAGGWRQGHVFCFQCDEPGCRHATIPHPAATFAGYTATGRPRWIGFTELCIARRDGRVERVFGEPPEVIAVVQSADELGQDVLAHVRGPGAPLSVLGQVVAGLLPAAYSSGSGHDRVAATVQVIQMPEAGRAGRFRLNLLGTSWEAIGAVLAEEGGHGPAEGLRSALAAARHRLQAQSRHANRRERAGETVDLEKIVMPILCDVQRDMERVFREHRWRTRHAEVRHRSGKRPTVTAVSEARSAPTNRLLHDLNRKTIVVLGRKGRAHVFSAEGRHVTSLQLGPGEVTRKTARGRWRALSETDARAFRRAVEQRANPTER